MPKRAMKSAIRGAFILAALVPLAPARAEQSATQFLADIDRSNTTSLLVLYGYGDGFGWANTELARNGEKRLFCVPGKLAITPEQNAEILRSYVKNHPVFGGAPGGFALLRAYEDTFPC